MPCSIASVIFPRRGGPCINNIISVRSFSNTQFIIRSDLNYLKFDSVRHMYTVVNGELVFNKPFANKPSLTAIRLGMSKYIKDVSKDSLVARAVKQSIQNSCQLNVWFSDDLVENQVPPVIMLSDNG